MRTEARIEYGDVPKFVNFDYVAAVGRLNAATLASLAAVPAPPGNVHLDTSTVENDSTLTGEPSQGRASALEWEHAQNVGNVTTTTTKLSKDNVIFGLRAVDNKGHRSLPVVPVPERWARSCTLRWGREAQEPILIRRTGSQMTLNFPPFTSAVTWLLAINTAVFLGLTAFGSAGVIRWVDMHLGLVPARTILHLEIWQIVTYSLIHVGFWHWFGNMLGIWMFGSTFESSWGVRRFLELFFTGVVGAAITTILLSFAHILSDPYTPTVGASGGLFAILMAFGIVFGENEIVLFPFPFLIKAKYFVLILIVVTVAFAISGGGNTAYLAHLGGLFFGYLYVKFARDRGMLGRISLSEWYYGLHNSYYRWKRRRAARKFEVYMRKHENREVSFDEHGNYIPPDDDKKKNGGSKSGWVN